jgi:5'(3')-deoxyribonucleotidase
MAKAEQFVFGVDLDGVVGDFYRAMRPIVAEWRGVKKSALSMEKFKYGLEEWGVRQDGEHYKGIHRYAVTQRNLFSNMPLIPGAAPALRRLSDGGVHIRIITHRLFIAHSHQQAVQQTVAWLDRHAIPYWDLCFLEDKVDVGADLYIEDTPDKIRALVERGQRVIVFTNPTNEHIEAELRASTWEAVESVVWDAVPRSGKKLARPGSLRSNDSNGRVPVPT